MKFTHCYELLLAALLLAGMGASAVQAGSLNVFVSIPPQRFFVEKIGGVHVQPAVMVPPGASPATYEPRPGQMVALSRAKIYFAVGVPFERTWLPRFQAANAHLLVVHTDSGIPKIAMARTFRPGRAPSSGLSHTGVKDPHIWLSPPLVKIQARHIYQALAGADPDHAAQYKKNFTSFVAFLDRLDREIRATLAGLRRREFMVFHPAWGYFARTYGLRQLPVEIEGKDPKPEQLQKLIRYGRGHGITAIFVQPQFSAKSARTVAAAIGAKVISADPLAADWAANLRRQAARFAAALR